MFPHRSTLVSLLVAVGLTALACEGPFLVLPGGPLSGETAEAPADWTFAGRAGTAQLETSGDEPYSVNVAYTVVDGGLFINAGDTETQWAKNIASDPNVRLRLDGKLYEVRAERESAQEMVDAFGEAWTGQSIFRRDPRSLDEVYLYRIVRR